MYSRYPCGMECDCDIDYGGRCVGEATLQGYPGTWRWPDGSPITEDYEEYNNNNERTKGTGSTATKPQGVR
jgi:hypothetical protein